MNRIKPIILMLFCIFLLSLFGACANTEVQQESSSVSKESALNTDYSFKKQMDIAMQHASNPKVLATVNGVEITQVDMDLFSIGVEKHNIDEIVKYYVVTDYAEKNSLQMLTWCQELLDSIEPEMNKDAELSEEYCLNTYGISKSEVIKYAEKRAYQIGMNSAFSDMIINEVSAGETPKKHPELKRAYKKFEKDKLSKGSEAWDNIEQAYYEMIAKDYDIVIY